MLDWIQATQGMKITSRFLSNSNRLRAEILKAYTVPNVVFRNLASRNKKYIVQHLYYTVYLKPKTDGKFFHILNLHCTVQYNIYIYIFFLVHKFWFRGQNACFANLGIPRNILIYVEKQETKCHCLFDITISERSSRETPSPNILN